jgi:nucleotide-binding universal stress UspA family protein
MFKNSLILVATDFSPASDLALKGAAILKEKWGGELLAVHVSEYPGSSDVRWLAVSDYLSEDVKRHMILAQENEFSKQLKRCEVKCPFEILSGKPYATLMETIKQRGVGLLVMGHQGAGSEHFFMGGLTDKLVSSAEIPVLVMNQHLRLAKVAGLIDPMEPIEKIYQASEAFSRLVSAELLMISLWKDISTQTVRRSPRISTDHEHYTDEEKNLLIKDMEMRIKEQIKGDVKLKVNITQTKSMAQALVQVMESEKVDLGIISRHKMGVVRKLFLGSVTRKLLDLYEGNLLILPPDEL